MNQIHKKVALRKAARKIGQVKFVVNEYTDFKNMGETFGAKQSS